MHRLLALAGLSTTLYSATALPQQVAEPRKFAIERFRPSMDGEGIFDVEWGNTKEFLAWDLALWLSYSNDPLVLRIDENGKSRRGPALVKHRLGGNIVGAVGLFPWLQLGADLPIALFQSQGDSLRKFAENPKSLSVGGTGDLRLRPKFRLLESQYHLVDLSVITMFTIPSNSSAAYLGEKGVAFEPEVVVSRALSEARLSGNIGYRLRPKTTTLNLTVDDEVTFRVGAAYPFEPRLGVPVEASVSFSGAFAASAPFRDANQSPMETLIGAAYDAYERVRVFAAFGFGLKQGFGTPDFRILAGVRLHTPAELDRDGDGLPDKEDGCPDDPEDKDEWEDEDGCPDLDNDEDGVLDVNDGAPNDPEDKDDFEDSDGVPDPDNDEDGIADSDDQCPNDAGPQDNKGCPDQDRDGDGIADRLDACPDQPEDKDEFEDDNGCPDSDNDQDGLPDDMDRCPNDPGPTENAGCPDLDRDGDTVVDRVDNCPDEPGSPDFNGCKEPQMVRLTADRIEILEKVFFDSGLATIQERSYGLLDSVASVLNAHPEIARIRVEGHTDDRGSAGYNKDLSQRRAEAVRQYLLGREVATERLEAVGYGEERPVASNATSRGRATNRRVEFTIVGEAPKNVLEAPDDAAPPEATDGADGEKPPAAAPPPPSAPMAPPAPAPPAPPLAPESGPAQEPKNGEAKAGADTP